MSRGDEVTALQAQGFSVASMAFQLGTTPQRVARALRERGLHIACVSTEHGRLYSNGAPCEACGEDPPVDRFRGEWVCADCLNPPEGFEKLLERVMDQVRGDSSLAEIQEHVPRSNKSPLHYTQMCRQIDRKFIEAGWPLMGPGGQLVRG